MVYVGIIGLDLRNDMRIAFCDTLWQSDSQLRINVPKKGEILD